VALIFILPFAFIKRKNKGKLFFFYDRYAIGGAQRVHLDILASVADMPKQVYFTRLSLNDKMKAEFYAAANATKKDIHFWCDNLLFRLFTVHFYAFYINRHKGAHVFSSNSTFFYDMLFFLNKNITKTELLHNFTYGNKGMEFFGLANHKYLDFRCTVDNATKQNILNQYKAYNIPDEYGNRVRAIEPGVYIPPAFNKNHDLPLNILYAGRGGPQKRITLLNEIAERCIKEGLPVKFHFAGTMMDELSEYVQEHSVLHGEISRQEDMYNLYKECHLILMTSAFEGFPMLIKEGMACGCIPVVTALEGNRTHLKDGYNALLIQNPEIEKAVIEAGYGAIVSLLNDEAARRRLSQTANEYAITHFDKARFMAVYHKFFSS
jgi:glycosyltransferase involved in cell wall biosynthesis